MLDIANSRMAIKEIEIEIAILEFNKIRRS